MRHGTFPRLRQSLNLWHPVICQSSHILPETFMISTLTMSIIKKMRAFLLAISFKYYKLKGGYRDSNPGPPEPQSGALTNCAIPTTACLKGFEPPTHGLEGWCSTIELHPHVVGVTGFEPATSWSQTRRSSQAEPHPVVYLFVISVTTKVIILQGFQKVNMFFEFF